MTEDNFLSFARETAIEVGGILKSGLKNKRHITRKDGSDYVTDIDRESEELIKRRIKSEFSGHSILAEESGKTGSGEYLWIIDPLDGTTNYIHGFPFFSVSIALKYRDGLILGVILDPLRDELFYAGREEGAFLNDSKIETSDTSNISEALVTTGFPFRAIDTLPEYLDDFSEIMQSVSGVRRAGSAALDLAYLACGRVDGFWEYNLNIWDIAAGVLILREAGGKVSDTSGSDKHLETGNICGACGEEIQKYILDAIRD